MALSGNEFWNVTGVTNTGQPSGSQEQVTISGIAAFTAAFTNSGSELKSQGFSLINSLGQNFPNCNLLTSSTLASGTVGGMVSAAWTEVATQTVPKIRLILTNFYGGLVNSVYAPEVASTNDIFVKIVICQNATVAPTVAGGAGEEFPVTVKGEKIIRIPPKSVIVTDDIDYPLTAGQAYMVKIVSWVAGNSLTLPVNMNTSGGAVSSNPVNPNVNESRAGFSIIGAANAATSGQGYLYAGVLGYTGTSPAKSLALVGDSIITGAYDAGAMHQQNSPAGSGYGKRICQQQFTNSEVYPGYTPFIGFMHLGRPSGTGITFTTAGYNKTQRELASFASTVLYEYGANDINSGSTLAQIQASMLVAAGFWASQGQYSIFTTITPHTTSTDGFVTAANQTVINAPAEATRVALNNWIRNTTSSGFVQQAAAATGYPASMFGVFDAAAAVEVNSSNFITQNGGLWLASKNGIIYSGTATAVNAASYQLTDSNLITGSTYNQYKGNTVNVTSGSQAGQVAGIVVFNNTTGFMTLATTNTYGGNFSVGDTYNMYNDNATTEGYHPSSFGYATIAKSFNTSIIQ